MMYYNELYHYGVKGMKWGVRRFQNKDGTLTSAGKKKYKGTRGDIEKQIDPENVDQYVKLQKEIEKKSGNWYLSEPVSKRFKDALDWSRSEEKRLGEAFYRDSKTRIKYNAERNARITSAILRDLGYNDTKAGREFLIDIGILD